MLKNAFVSIALAAYAVPFTSCKNSGGHDGDQDNSDSDADTNGNGSDADTDSNDLDSETGSNGDPGVDTSMSGGCDAPPSSYDEQMASLQNAPGDWLVAYSAYKGIDESGASKRIGAIFELTLWEEFGAQLAPSETDLSEQQDFATCSTCLRFHQKAQLGAQNKLIGSLHTFMPKSGKLVVEALEPKAKTIFKFKVDAEMVEVEIDPQTQETTPVEGGCSFQISEFGRYAQLAQ